MTTMPNTHKSRKLFLHEKTRLRAGATDRFVAAFGDHYRPLMEQAGARLFGIWEAATINARWPEITTIWEIDSYKHLSDIGGGRFSDPGGREAHQRWLGCSANSMAMARGGWCSAIPA